MKNQLKKLFCYYFLSDWNKSMYLILITSASKIKIDQYGKISTLVGCISHLQILTIGH